ncbi:MAG TPA: hypothetical protein VKV21_06570 [Solirubrobacteraceae bacterium]|nr:hypothetical protein [Solirubrobacteraceae bacterium]
MTVTAPPTRRSRLAPVLLTAVAAVVAAGLGPIILFGFVSSSGVGDCAGGSATTTTPVLGPGGGARVGATEYGGPGDPSSGSVGSSGVDLATHPDSYAELGGTTFQTATAMGGLPYETPLRITWRGRSVIAYKRDIGLGGGPIDGVRRAIDLWWELTGALGIPYEEGRWSGVVHVERPPASGAGSLLGATAATVEPVASTDGALPSVGGVLPAACGGPPVGSAPAPVTAGPRARLLSNGSAAAPASAPPAVRGIIAAGNQIVGKPYEYGGGHGLPLDQIAATYDCSSSVLHLLYGGGLVGVDFDADSGALMSWGEPGPGRWVTIYASPDHVFMYVAGLRWDTHNAAGPGDGSTGIGWHPLVREANGFVARHPAGL